MLLLLIGIVMDRVVALIILLRHLLTFIPKQRVNPIDFDVIIFWQTLIL